MALTAAEVVNAAEDLSLPELETVIAQLMAVRARRAIEAGRSAETDLIHLIKDAIPAVVQRRYDQLKVKRRTTNLTEAEHEEFLRLIDVVEEIDAQRVQYLAQLARLRGTTVEQVMASLSLTPPPMG